MSKVCYAISIAIVNAVLAYSAKNDSALNDELFRAIRNNDTPSVNTLLRRGAGVNAKDQDGATPLMQAALYGDPGLLKLLLDKGADPNARNKVGATALLWSVHDLRKVRLLVQKGANANARSEGGKMPLLLAAYYSRSAETVKFLLENGADLRAKDNRGAGVLLFAAEGGDLDTIRLLLDKGIDVNAGTAGEFDEIRFGNLGPPPGFEPARGVTALMVTAFSNDAAAARLLLDRGAVVNAKASDGLTALLACANRGGGELIKTLVEKGADVNVVDTQGRTPLILMAAGDYTEPETIRLLLDKGASVNVKGKDGRNALAWALQRGDTPVVKLLMDAGAKYGEIIGPEAAAAAKTGGYGLRQAVGKALPVLQAAGPQVVKQRGCITCHNQSIPAMAVSMARQQGFAVNEQIARQELKAAVAVLGPHRENLLQHINSVPATPEVASYALAGMAAEKYPADRFTDALVHDLAQKQRRDGSWLSGDGRPPIEQSDFSSTALTLRALQLYPIAGRREEFERRIADARGWLLAARTRSNEDRTFRLLGLAWAKADLQDALHDLLAQQRPDGGWAGLATLDEDAYATGQALVALQEAGMSVSNEAYQHGVKYLLSTQLEDGSWHVRTRAMGFQPYFESGFPHGHDQWISSAGTAWAVMALAAAAEPVKTAAR
jgi:ankyrin repeat protein